MGIYPHCVPPCWPMLGGFSPRKPPSWGDRVGQIPLIHGVNAGVGGASAGVPDEEMEWGPSGEHRDLRGALVPSSPLTPSSSNHLISMSLFK